MGDMTGEPNTGGRLFEIVFKDITCTVLNSGTIVDAWRTDNGPNKKKYGNCSGINTHEWLRLSAESSNKLVVSDSLLMKVEYRAVTGHYLCSEQILAYNEYFWVFISLSSYNEPHTICQPPNFSRLTTNFTVLVQSTHVHCAQKKTSGTRRSKHPAHLLFYCLIYSTVDFIWTMVATCISSSLYVLEPLSQLPAGLPPQMLFPIRRSRVNFGWPSLDQVSAVLKPRFQTSAKSSLTLILHFYSCHHLFCISTIMPLTVEDYCESLAAQELTRPRLAHYSITPIVKRYMTPHPFVPFPPEFSFITTLDDTPELAKQGGTVQHQEFRGTYVPSQITEEAGLDGRNMQLNNEDEQEE